MLRRIHTLLRLALGAFVAVLAMTAPARVASADCLDPPGDITADGQTNVLDVHCEIKDVLWRMLAGEDTAPPPCVKVPAPLTDLNCDEVHSIGDVQVVLRIALHHSFPPQLDPDGDLCLIDCDPDDCTAEGEAFPVVPGALPCCKGLVPVGCSAPDKQGQCNLCVGASFCTACGDGICGLGENECRCPEDCPAMGTCWGNADCLAGEFCAFDGCSAETGVCQPKPEACYMLYDPVCGCDGKTYSNGCFAAMAGVTVDHAGECTPPMCWTDEMCAKDEYCYFAQCGLKSGKCLTRPAICPLLWAPVCSCDGVTYANACTAAQHGASVDFQGECDVTHCWGNAMCAKSEYCYFAECAQETGQCEARPIVCPLLWSPVCGCDGNTYANSCLAASSRASVDYPGPCTID